MKRGWVRLGAMEVECAVQRSSVSNLGVRIRIRLPVLAFVLFLIVPI